MAKLFAGGDLGFLMKRDEKLETYSGASTQSWQGKAVVLVDRGTQGAAEVFAQILRQNGGAKLVGQPTFGFAGRSKVIDLDAGGSIVLTDAFFTGPDGEPVDEGIEPDVLVGDRRAASRSSARSSKTSSSSARSTSCTSSPQPPKRRRRSVDRLAIDETLPSWPCRVAPVRDGRRCEAARRQVSGRWRAGGGGGGERVLVVLALSVALIGVGFVLGRWSAGRGFGTRATSETAPGVRSGASYARGRSTRARGDDGAAERRA